MMALAQSIYGGIHGGIPPRQTEIKCNIRKHESAVFVCFVFFTSFRDNGTPGPHTGSNAVGNERPGQRKEWSVSEAQAGAPSLQRGSHALWPQGYGGPLAASMACGARDRMIRAGLRAPRGERSYDQN